VIRRAAVWALAALLSPLGAGVVQAQASQQDAFVVRLGADTFAVENMTRTADRLSGEMTGRGIGRLVYSATLGPAAAITALTLRAWPPGADPERPPAQEVRLTLEGDSVGVVITTPAGTQTQRLGTRLGALLYLNPSFGLTEQMVLRARALGGNPAEVPVFMLQGGQTLGVAVSWPAPDSVAMQFAGSAMRGVVDDAGRLLSVSIPAQNLTVTRVAGRHLPPFGVAPPDYSAPAGAPYTAEEVRVETPMGHTLAGTFTRPAGPGRAPAVVTITGSGPQDRDQSIPILAGYRPMREVADTLGRRGIAVLRLDDRGFGASGGDFATATSADFAADVAAAVAYLRGRPDVDPARIGLVGHSEGGLIAPMVAAADTLLAGIVLIAGPAQTGREIIEYQQRFVIEGSLAIPPESRDSALAAAAAQLEEALATQPWLRFFVEHDPLPVAERVRRTPVLIVHGETDRQVTVEQAESLAAAFRRGGNADVTVRVLPEINHLLLRDPDGSPEGYATLPSFALDRGVLGAVADWAAARLRAGSAR
jgi:uncharacterized protein